MATVFLSLPHPRLKPTNVLFDHPKPHFLPPSSASTTTIYTSSRKNGGRALCFNGSPTKNQKRNLPPRKIPTSREVTSPEEGPPICPGCGVFMQDRDPDLPGYYKKKESRVEDPDEILVEGSDDEGGFLPKSDLDEEILVVDEEEEEEEEELSDGEEEIVETKGSDWEFTDDDFDGDDYEDEEERWKKELDGFAPPGVGYGNVTEEYLRKIKKEKISKSEKKWKAREAAKKRALEDDGAAVCARCHSLRHYGQVKNQNAENLIPDFDFDRLVVSSLMKPASTAPVVVMVVDCVDFDGSFPKNAAKSLFKALEEGKEPKGNYRRANSPKLVLVATKVDLLPKQISPTRLDRWVRHRAKAWGAPKISGVYLVSAHKDLGVRNLLSFIKGLSGPRSNVWVIGSQNAGKSTLINTFAKKEGVKLTRLTEAAVPGTTLGILRIVNLLPGKAKMYDTPGLLHPYLMGTRLNREEQKMIEIRKELQPRSYRVKPGQTIHVGGLARLDVIQTSVETIYITVWASQNISLHMGKTENAEDTWNNHIGIRLQPPVGQDRTPKIDQWIRREMKVSGVTWEVNSSDIAIAGLGWFSVGLKGEATVVLWTYDGVEVTQREPLVLDRAPFIERPGFFLPKAISDALRNNGRQEVNKVKPRNQDFLLEVST